VDNLVEGVKLTEGWWRS